MINYSFIVTYYFYIYLIVHLPGSSVDIVTAYGLDGPGIETR